MLDAERSQAGEDHRQGKITGRDACATGLRHDPPAGGQRMIRLRLPARKAYGSERVLSRKPRSQNHLGGLVSKPGEKSGLGLILDSGWGTRQNGQLDISRSRRLMALKA